MRISLDCKTKVFALALGLALPASVLPWAAAAQSEDIIPTEAVFDPANFVDPATNVDGYHPTRPGMQWIRAGTTEVGSRKVPHMAISTITDVYRTIEGVPCVAMLDQSTDNGEISQVGFDYMAVDKAGNVWIMGGYTEEFEGGVFTNVEGAYLGTATGGKRGILTPTFVTMDTPRWLIGTPGPEEDPSVGEPVEIGIDLTVAYGTFHDVRAIREGGVNAPDNEIKYYAPGVGVVLNVPRIKSLHQDSFELVNFIDLSPEGLTEASQVVLDLEAHARIVAPEVYADAPLAERHP